MGVRNFILTTHGRHQYVSHRDEAMAVRGVTDLTPNEHSLFLK